MNFFPCPCKPNSASPSSPWINQVHSLQQYMGGQLLSHHQVDGTHLVARTICGRASFPPIDLDATLSGPNTRQACNHDAVKRAILAT